jgi:hypothetical protein
MTFLQPFILWGLPLILLPVIIHLINRMRHRPQPWAAMRFLVSATRASTSHAKLRQLLILLFRVFAVAMLVLFLARPLAGGWMGWMLSPAPDVVLILLDRSASMETQVSGTTTKREQALNLISQAAKQFQGASHLVLIDSATRAPQEINALNLAGVSLTASTDTAADIPSMLQAAFNYLIENRSGSAEIWIASDLQRSNWQPDDGRFKSAITQFTSLPQKIRVRLLALNQPAERNASVALEDIARRDGSGKSELQSVLDLQRNDTSTEPFPVQVTLNGAESEALVTMDSNAMRWRHKVDIGAKQESGWGSFRLPADANTHDNTAYFAFAGETPLRSVIIGTDDESSRILRAASAAIARNAESASLVSVSDFASFKLEDRSLIVWQAPVPAGSDADRIRNFIEQGGSAIFLPPGTPDAQEFGGMRWGEIQNAEEDKPLQVARWTEDEGPLAKTDEGFTLPLGQTEIKRRQLIAGQKIVLAAFADGESFLARQTIGKGQVYFCASLPEETWSTLADGPVLVPMLQRLLQSGSKRLQEVTFINCGQLSLTDQQKQWQPVDSTNPKNVNLHAGVYRSGERLIAVNRPAIENDPEILDVNETRNLFSGLSFQMLQDRETRTSALQGEIWRFFLFGMLAFLIGESFLILPGKNPRRTDLATQPT